jgi:hypothetical protein
MKLPQEYCRRAGRAFFAGFASCEMSCRSAKLTKCRKLTLKGPVNSNKFRKRLPSAEDAVGSLAESGSHTNARRRVAIE